jgi:pyruvate kinase
MLLWGTYPLLCARFHDTDSLVNMAEDILESHAGVQERQIVGIVAGTRTRSGATNFMRLHMIGDRESDVPSKSVKVRTGKPAKKVAKKSAKRR